MDWDSKRRQVYLSMPNYIKKALNQSQHILEKKRHQQFPGAKIIYGTAKQYTTQQSSALHLDKQGNKFIQQVFDRFLFLGRAVDSALLCPISAISSKAAIPTEDTPRQTAQLLEYIATQEEAVLTYKVSNMKLTVQYDASYLSESKTIAILSCGPGLKS